MIPPTCSKKGTRFFSTGSAEYLASVGIVVWIWADMCWAIKLLLINYLGKYKITNQ
jgi:hypothetical protein